MNQTNDKSLEELVADARQRGPMSADERARQRASFASQTPGTRQATSPKQTEEKSI
jgi:hypothetical protein